MIYQLKSVYHGYTKKCVTTCYDLGRFGFLIYKQKGGERPPFRVILSSITNGVPGVGLEPTRAHRSRDFKSLVSTNSTTRAIARRRPDSNR